MSKRIMAFLLAAAMAVSMAACGTANAPAESKPAETPAATTPAAPAETTPADDPNRPAAVSAEDWEAMKKEPVFGTQLNYMYNGGNCVSAQYIAEKMGYYAEYGIDATFVTGGDSAVAALGSNSIQWTIDHIATLLVPITNNVEYTFVNGAHIGCKSIYVLKDSPIQTAADLKGKTIAIHDGLGNSDHNIVARLCDEYGVDPTKDVELLVVETSATIAGMQNGEIDASIFGDTWAYDMEKSGELRRICSITFDEAFQDEPCCVVAMSTKFIQENPVHAKYVTMAVKRAGEYNRLNSDEAVQFMLDDSRLSGTFEKNIEIWDTLYFGLSDAFTKRALEEIASDYIRLGLITADMSVEEIMAKAWTPACPDEEMPEGYTVGDPVPVEGNVVSVKQKGDADVAVAEKEVSLTVSALSAAEIEAMKSEPQYAEGLTFLYGSGNCTSAPYIAMKLGLYDQYGIKAEQLKGVSTLEALGSNQAQVNINHIATMLVPCTNGVNFSFVGGAHIGCQSLFVLADSEYYTTEDLRGKAISAPNGIGNSSYNIMSRMFDHDGINPLTDIEITVVETDACVVAMENGEIAGLVTGDTWAYKMVKDGKLRVVRSLMNEDFAQEPCCVMVMNNDFIKENPNMAKAVTECLKIASDWMRQNPGEAVDMLIEDNLLSTSSISREEHIELWNTLQFGPSDAMAEAALKTIIDDYIRLDLLTATDDAAEVLAKAWNPLLPDSDLGYDVNTNDGSWWD